MRNFYFGVVFVLKYIACNKYQRSPRTKKFCCLILTRCLCIYLPKEAQVEQDHYLNSLQKFHFVFLCNKSVAKFLLQKNLLQPTFCNTGVAESFYF